MRVAICFVFIAVVGCAAGGTAQGPGGSGFSDNCDARAQGGLVGNELTDMASIAGAAPKVRFIGPNDGVTQDLQPDRLNIEFDQNRVVTRVYCG